MLAAGRSVGPDQIAAEVYAGIPGVNFELAAMQVLTHLKWLQRGGRARLDDGLWRAA